MKTLLARDLRGREEGFGPDPLLLKKRGLSDIRSRDISEFKKKILDDKYMDHAINRIAMELSHFLLR